MFTFIKILFIIAAVLAVVGFITGTFGLIRSFMLDRFNRFVYLGLAVISVGALVAGLAFGVSYLHIRSALNDAFSGQEQSQPVYDAPEPVESVEESTAPLDSVSGPDSTPEGEWVDDGMYPEDLVAAAVEGSPGVPECVQSDEAEEDSAFYIVDSPQYIISGETYLVPISETEAFISIGIHEDDNAVVYVNADTYEMYSSNDSAEYYTFMGPTNDVGTDSEAFKVAETCGM